MKIIKYTFDVPVVAMVSHIPAKGRMAVNYVIYRSEKPYFTLHFFPVSLPTWVSKISRLTENNLFSCHLGLPAQTV